MIMVKLAFHTLNVLAIAMKKDKNLDKKQHRDPTPATELAECETLTTLTDCIQKLLSQHLIGRVLREVDLIEACATKPSTPADFWKK